MRILSLRQLIDRLLNSLQPLARKRNNTVFNNVPQGLCFHAEENLLAYILSTLFSKALQTKYNEFIRVQTLVDDHRTMICIDDADHCLYQALAPEYHRLQTAAQQCGGRIDIYGDGTANSNIAFSISNRRMIF